MTDFNIQARVEAESMVHQADGEFGRPLTPPEDMDAAIARFADEAGVAGDIEGRKLCLAALGAIDVDAADRFEDDDGLWPHGPESDDDTRPEESLVRPR